MTDKTINETIAKACGKPVCDHGPDQWEHRGPESDRELYCTQCQKYLSDMRGPRYCSDLNAMHEAEQSLTEKQVPFYLTRLLQVRYHTGADHGMIACMQDKLAFATARQRAEAFLRTLGKWNDGKSADPIQALAKRKD